MANTILTIGLVTREAVRLWKNSNSFLQCVDMQFDDSYAVSGAKVGSSIRIRLPSDYTVATGTALQLQDTAEQSVVLTLATQKNVSVGFNSQERTMALDDYGRRVLAPAINNLVGAVAVDIMSGIEGGISNFIANQDPVGNIISPNQGTFLNAGATLDLNSAPTENRRIINGPRTEARTVSALSGLLNPTSMISDQNRFGRMYDALGFMWMKDPTVITHTNGTLAQGSLTVNGAGQTGLQIVVNASAGTLAVGDIIVLANVNKVNKITKGTTGELCHFVVTSPLAVNGTVLNIFPAVIPPVGGQQVQYQTVTASPANGAAVNPVSNLPASATYRKNFAFAPEAVTLAMADLELPMGVHEAARESFDGVSLSMISDYIIQTGTVATRIDVLYGYLWIRPEWGCIVADQL